MESAYFLGEVSNFYRTPIIKDKDTSIHFFKFLAENVAFNDNFKSLPFIADNDTVVDDFKNKLIFFTSEEGHKVCESEWMSSIAVAFVSDDYAKATKDYLKENFGVLVFSDEIIVKDVVLSEDYHDEINNCINGDFSVSKSFFLYCFSQKDYFESGDLRNYSLHAFDGDGNGIWCLTEEHVYFQSNLYDEFAIKEWVNYDWMYALDESYMEDVASPSDLKDFVEKTFWVEELTLKKIYTDIVKPSNPQLSPSTSFLRVHVHLLLNLQIIRTEIPTSANNIPLPHNAT